MAADGSSVRFKLVWTATIANHNLRAQHAALPDPKKPLLLEWRRTRRSDGGRTTSLVGRSFVSDDADAAAMLQCHRPNQSRVVSQKQDGQPSSPVVALPAQVLAVFDCSIDRT